MRASCRRGEAARANSVNLRAYPRRLENAGRSAAAEEISGKSLENAGLPGFGVLALKKVLCFQ
jgi:hypothetical protein